MLQKLFKFIKSVFLIGVEGSMGSSFNRVTVFTNGMAVFGLVFIWPILASVAQTHQHVAYFIPMLSIWCFGWIVLYSSWKRNHIMARLVALGVLVALTWNAVVLYGKSFNGYLIFYVALLYSVIAFSRQKFWLKWGSIIFVTLNMPVIDALSFFKIVPITGFHSDNFGVGILIVDSFAVMGMMVILTTIEKFFSDKYEDEITNLNENLEQIVEKRTKMLVEAKEEAIQASLLKSQFVANTSHELRTPVQGLMGFVSMAQRRLGKIKTASEDDQAIIQKIESSLASAEQSSNRLLNLIDTLLKITRTESQGFEARPSHFDVDSVLSEVVSGAKTAATNKGCTIQMYSTAATKQIYTDRTLLVQTIENLVGNAVRYSTASTPIDVSLEENGDYLELSVINQGPGVDPNETQKIFEAFVQGSRTDNTTGGTGLGLSLCKKYAAALGGEVVLKDPSPEHTTFVLRFKKTLPSP